MDYLFKKLEMIAKYPTEDIETTVIGVRTVDARDILSHIEAQDEKIAALEHDRERLDWIFKYEGEVIYTTDPDECRKRWKIEYTVYEPSLRYDCCAWFDTPREAIDAAMEAEAKDGKEENGEA